MKNLWGKTVMGLRESERPSPVRVYRLRKDGTKGHLIRVESIEDLKPRFGRYAGKK